MAVVSIRIDGVDVTDDVVIEGATFRSLADGQSGEANIVIDDQEHKYTKDDIGPGKRLALFIDGVREWDGWIFVVSRAWPLPAMPTDTPDTVPRLWKIRGFDRNILFQKRFMYRVADPTNDSGLRVWPEDTSDKVAIEYALEHHVDLSGDGLTFDIQSVGSPGPFEEFTLGYVSAPLGVLFEDASKITGAVFYIDPQRVLRYTDDITVTAPYVLSDAPTAGQVGYREMDAALDFSHAGNHALVWGAGKGSADPVFGEYIDEDSVAAHGRWQWGDLYLGAWKQQTVNRRARTYVNGSPSHRRGHGQPVPVARCTVFQAGFRAGQVADFRSEAFGYQQALPIRSCSITFLTKSAPRFDLEMSLKVDTPFGVPDLWKFYYPPFDSGETVPPEGPGGWKPPEGGGSETTVCSDTLIDHYDTGENVYYVGMAVYGPVFDGVYGSFSGVYGYDNGYVTAIREDGSRHTWIANPVGWGEVRYLEADATGVYVNLIGGIGPYVPGGSNYVRNGVYKFSPEGVLLWSHVGGSYWSDTPMVLRAGSLVIEYGGATGWRNIMAIDPATGTMQWSYTAPASIYSHAVNPDGSVWVFMASSMHLVSNTGTFIRSISSSVIGGSWAHTRRDANQVSKWSGSTLTKYSLSSSTPVATTASFSPVQPDYIAHDLITDEVFGHEYYQAVALRADGTKKWTVDTRVYRSFTWFQDAAKNGVFVAVGHTWLGGDADSTIVDVLNQSDGSVKLAVEPFGEDAVDGYSVFGVAVGGAGGGDGTTDEFLVTPGQDVTSAPWPGGNVYEAGGTQRWGVSDSVIRSPAGYSWWGLRDSEILLLREDDEWDFLYVVPGKEQPFSGFSTAYWSDGVTSDEPSLLIKWRYVGDAIPTSGLGVSWLGVSIPLTGATESDVWLTELVGTLGLRDQLMVDTWYAWQNDDPAWQAMYESFPYHAYQRADLTPVHLPNVWYYTRIQPGQVAKRYGSIPVSDLPLARMKTWPVDEPEPVSGDSPFEWYWAYSSYTPPRPPDMPPETEILDTATDGWTLQLPHQWQPNRTVDQYDRVNHAEYYTSNILTVWSYAAGFEVDAVWSGACVIIPGGGGNTGSTLIDIPVYDNVENDRPGVYITSYPYVPGSLVVYYQGTRLRPSWDYIETDPSSGEFRIIMDNRDLSAQIYVRYKRAGSTPTSSGGTVYRPAPVLQYGWGTPLDGWNCAFACGSMALDRHTLGQNTVYVGSPRNTPPNQRGFQSDQSGGASLGDVAVAWANGWGATLHSPGLTSWSNFVSNIASGRGAILSGRYGSLPASKRFSTSFTGPHAIYINENFSNGNFWGIDPLYRYPIIYTTAELQAYAEGLSYVGPGQVSAAFTRMTS
jgi:hypothetical protein